MWIEKRLKDYWQAIGKNEKKAFFISFFCGLLAHLYMYANTIPNFDGISRVYDEQQMTISGRWFLHYVSYLHGFVQSPMVLGVLTVLFLSLTAACTVHLMGINSGLLAGLWSCILVVFPSVAYTNGYIFTASAYAVAIYLATLCVFVTKKYKWGFLPAAVLFALAMGTYQTYVTVAISLALLLVLAEALDGSKKVKDILVLGVKYLICFALGTVIYYVVLKVFLAVKDLKLISYLNMNDVEKGYPIDQLPDTLLKTYREVGNFFFGKVGQESFSKPWINGIHWFLLCFCILSLFSVVYRKKLYKDVGRMLGIAAVLVLLPVGVNFTQVMSPYSTPSSIMKFAYVFCYLLPVVLLDRECILTNTAKLFQTGAAITVCVLVLLFGYYWVYDNTLYTMLGQSHRATLSFVTNVVSRIESLEGYQYGMEVVVVGGFPSDRYYAGEDIYRSVQQGGAIAASQIPLNKHIYYYMQDWLNVAVAEPAEEVFFAVTEDERFAQMPLYPSDGSVAILDGRVVVKMQEQFTPKATYEKEYEQRR